MGTWSFVSLTVIGDKKDVSAFDRVALQLPVLSDYVIERDGKPITWAIFEDMIFENPRRWCKHWWHSCYHFSTRVPESAIEMVQDVSKKYTSLCFQVDSNCEHEELRSNFIRRGRVEYQDYNAAQRREALFKELTCGVDDGNDEVDWEIDAIVSDEFKARCKRLWHRRIYRVLYAQRRRK